MLCCGFSVSVESFFCFNHSVLVCVHAVIFIIRNMMHADILCIILYYMHVYTQKSTEKQKKTLNG